MNNTARIVGSCIAIAVLAFGVSCASVEPLDGASLLGFDSGAPHGGQPNGGNPNTGAGGFVPTDLGAGGFPLPPAAGGMLVGLGGKQERASGGASAGGARGTGGAPAAGGRMGTGGTPRESGGMSNAGGSGPPNCAANEKICGGVCAAPSPKVGCGMTGCDACSMTPPANGYLNCTNGMCGFDCLSGYMKMGSTCEGPPPGSTGGGCPSSPIGCPSCGAVFGPGCCNGSKCGCSPIPYTIGILGCL